MILEDKVADTVHVEAPHKAGWVGWEGALQRAGLTPVPLGFVSPQLRTCLLEESAEGQHPTGQATSRLHIRTSWFTLFPQDAAQGLAWSRCSMCIYDMNEGIDV